MPSEEYMLLSIEQLARVFFPVKRNQTKLSLLICLLIDSLKVHFEIRPHAILASK